MRVEKTAKNPVDIIFVLPEYGIRLDGHGAGAVRFARLFHETWLEISPDDATVDPRSAILRRWGELGPIIEFTHDHRGLLPGEVAICLRRGTALYFHSDYVNRMPDAVVKTLVAHELAHVHQYATGHMDELDLAAAEGDVTEILEQWGFDQSDLDVWVRRNDRGDAE